jgi:hypothetical protein
MDDADCSCRIAFSSILITFYKNDRTKLNNISTIKNKLQFANFIVRYLKRNKNSVNRLHLRHYFPLPQRKNFTVVAYLLVGYLIAQILAHRLEEEAIVSLLRQVFFELSERDLRSRYFRPVRELFVAEREHHDGHVFARGQGRSLAFRRLPQRGLAALGGFGVVVVGCFFS